MHGLNARISKKVPTYSSSHALRRHSGEMRVAKRTLIQTNGPALVGNQCRALTCAREKEAEASRHVPVGRRV